MPQSNSSTYWILGCVATALAVVVLCCGGVLLMVPRAIRSLEGGIEGFGEIMGEMVAQEMERAEFSGSWQPPASEVEAPQLFPEHVAGYDLAEHDLTADVPTFGIEGIPGRQAVYSRNSETIELYVYEVSNLEREAIYRRLLETIDEDFSIRIVVGTSESPRLRFQVRPPRTYGWLWWSQDWLFFFTSGTHEDLESFANEYLRAIEGAGQTAEHP